MDEIVLLVALVVAAGLAVGEVAVSRFRSLVAWSALVGFTALALWFLFRV